MKAASPGSFQTINNRYFFTKAPYNDNIRLSADVMKIQRRSILMRKLATAAASFSAAVFLSHYLIGIPWLIYCSAIFAILSLTGFFFRTSNRLRVFLVCLGLVAGFLWNFAYYSFSYAPALLYDGKTETVSAVVLTSPEQTDTCAKVLVRLIGQNAPGVKTQLYIYNGMPSLTPGNTIQFSAKFRLADTIYGEKTETFFSKGIYLLASLKSGLTITDASTPILYFPNRMAQAVTDKVVQIFPRDTSAFIRALILGDTADVYKDTALNSALTSTGTSHIISVSGMNVAFLLGFMSLFIKNKRLLAFFGIPVIILFISVVGLQPPVTRAGIMQLFVLLAPLFKRESDAVTSLSASLFLILLCNPFSAGSAGLQLSFSATLGILLFTEKIYHALDSSLQTKKLYQYRLLRASLRFIFANFATTIGALIFSVPLIALHFGTVSLIAPLSNLLILWAVTLAFCGGIAAILLGSIFVPAGTAFAFLVALPVRYIIVTIECLSRAPLALVYTSDPAIIIWLVYIYAMFIAVFALRGKFRQLIYPVCLSVVFLCLLSLSASAFSDRGSLLVTALDVGQGQCVVVSSGKSTVLIDCGSTSGKNAGDIATRYIQSHGCSHIDLLILTHFHADHANGVKEVLERNLVSAVVLPDPSTDHNALAEEIIALASDKGIAIIEVTENLSVSFADASLRLYAPLGKENENERGLSILCSENGFDALITGDMSADMERQLIAAASFPDIELLIVGHHGSKNATSDELLDTVKPEAAVISVGYNTYGHPAAETLLKLSLNGITTYRTDQDRDVTFVSRQRQ